MGVKFQPFLRKPLHLILLLVRWDALSSPSAPTESGHTPSTSVIQQEMQHGVETEAPTARTTCSPHPSGKGLWL